MNRDIDTNTVYVLNPEYSLKVDKKRVIIINSKDADISRREVNGFVHPVHAVLLSLFNGKRRLEEVVEAIVKILKTNRSNAADLIFPMLENEEPLSFKYDGYFFNFPDKVLVKAVPNISRRKYDMDSFFIPKKDLDMESLRLYSPINAMLMVNTLCATDCIYCYADKRESMDCKIPIERLKELIREANKLVMRSIDVTGGELFLYSRWEELLAELLSNDFHPYISTKFPIDREIVYKLKDLGIKRIQISLDSIVAEELMLMLNVGEDYYHKILETFRILDESGLEIYTNSQVSSINQDSIYKLLDFLLNLKNVKRISMGAVGFSLYKGGEHYLRLRPSLEKVKKVEPRPLSAR